METSTVPVGARNAVAARGPRGWFFGPMRLLHCQSTRQPIRKSYLRMKGVEEKKLRAWEFGSGERERPSAWAAGAELSLLHAPAGGLCWHGSATVWVLDRVGAARVGNGVGVAGVSVPYWLGLRRRGERGSSARPPSRPGYSPTWRVRGRGVSAWRVSGAWEAPHPPGRRHGLTPCPCGRGSATQ
jgi:hypothetical protein